MPGAAPNWAVRAPLRRHTPRNGQAGKLAPAIVLHIEVNYPMAFPDPG
jgi:hypothetical protein